MWRLVWLLVFIKQCMGSVRTWDIAVTSGSELKFYSNYNNSQIYEQTLKVPAKDLTALAYDPVQNRMFYVGRQNDNAYIIFSYHLATMKQQALLSLNPNENIYGLAFDPVQELLFWTDTVKKSVYWVSIKESIEDLNRNLLVKEHNKIPSAVAVDSCRGYIYWTNINITNGSTLERIRFDGTEGHVVVDSGLYMPLGLAIDQISNQIYWINYNEDTHYTIGSADLEGNSNRIIQRGINQRPSELTISKDSIFWIDKDNHVIWMLPKSSIKSTQPIKYQEYSNEMPIGIVVNHPIEEQITGQLECKNLKSLLQTTDSSTTETSFDISTKDGLDCVHGTQVPGKLICECKPGYIGDRCSMSVCFNYCLQGNCTITTNGEPMCRCINGFTGTRCKTDICRGYCLNNGVCSYNEENEIVCQCLAGYGGSRCETFNTEITTFEISSTISSIESTILDCDCNSKDNRTSTPSEYLPQPVDEGYYHWSESGNVKSRIIRLSVIVAFSILIGILIVQIRTSFSSL